MRRFFIISLAVLTVAACGQRQNKKATVPATEQPIAGAPEQDVQPTEPDAEEVMQLRSDDGNVHISGWEKPGGGTMGSYGNKIEYKWGGKTLCQESLDSGTGEALMPLNIYTLGDGKYILYQYFREWSSQAYIEAATFELTADGLRPIALFQDADSLADKISVEYNIPGWYFRAGEGDGYEWLYYFDKAKKILYHPSSPEYNYLSDRYIPYQWNGKTLVPGAEVGNPFLHPSLGAYEALVSLFRTERNLVRIDSLPDGTFRYAAWGKKATMKDMPELVIPGGTYDEKAQEWVFHNKEYTYHVSAKELYILKNGKEIARWPQI